jgi:hypothetical protein
MQGGVEANVHSWYLIRGFSASLLLISDTAYYEFIVVEKISTWTTRTPHMGNLQWGKLPIDWHTPVTTQLPPSRFSGSA